MATVLAVASATLGLGACGDDEDDGASSQFCEIARKLNEAEGFPPEEQMDRYVTLAPDAIKGDAELAINALKKDAEKAYDDPDVVKAVERIEEFEADECDIQRPG